MMDPVDKYMFKINNKNVRKCPLIILECSMFNFEHVLSAGITSKKTAFFASKQVFCSCYNPVASSLNNKKSRPKMFHGSLLSFKNLFIKIRMLRKRWKLRNS